MDLRILREQPVVKFNRQLPIFNWPYPFDRPEDQLSDCLQPYLQPTSDAVSRRAIYIHIPFCTTICTFCPFQRDRYKSDDDVDDYVRALILEMDLKREFIGRRPVHTIFIGGGTPSILNLRHIEKIGDAIARNFDLRSLSEFTCEVEVKSVSREKLRALRDIGVSRISFGAQTFSEQYRSIFALDATPEQLTDAALLINSMFLYTNVDMLYGMAGQNFEQVLADVLAITSLKTTTIDVYPINNLSAMPAMHMEMSRAGLKLLPEATRVQFRIYIEQVLQDLGYAAISGYGFAKKSHSETGVVQHSPKFLYHDLIYGYYGDEIIGYGSSSFSQLPGFNIYNYANRRSYTEEILSNQKLPHLSFGPIRAPERGIVTFPFRGVLEKSKIPWEEVPKETMHALLEALDAELIAEQDDAYTLTRAGWIFYVNLMYYFMPSTSKRWIADEIERQTKAGKRSGDTSLAVLRYQ